MRTTQSRRKSRFCAGGRRRVVERLVDGLRGLAQLALRGVVALRARSSFLRFGAATGPLLTRGMGDYLSEMEMRGPEDLHVLRCH